MIKDSIQVVALAFNEEGTLKTVLERAWNTLKMNCSSFELLVYDDGSTDKTNEIANAFAREFPNVRVIRNERNMGIGWLLKQSYLMSTHDWTVVICSDMQFDPNDLELFLPYLKDYGIVISGRGGRRDASVRKLITRVDKFLLKALFSASFYDLHWIKFVHSRHIDKANITANSPFVETELLLRAKKKGARIKEIVVPHHPRTHGVAKGASFSNITKSVKDMLMLYFRI